MEIKLRWGIIEDMKLSSVFSLIDNIFIFKQKIQNTTLFRRGVNFLIFRCYAVRCDWVVLRNFQLKRFTRESECK